MLARLGRQSQARFIQRVAKASCSLEVAAGSLRQRCLQCPNKHVVPRHGGGVWAAWAGGRRGKRRGAILSRARRRDGERHPDSRGVGNLRGSPEERESWSVRLGCRGLVPRLSVAPATAGALWKNEEGNVVSVRQAHALLAEAPKRALHVGGHVLRSVQRPVHVSRHRTPTGKLAGGVARVEVSRSGKPAQAGGTGGGVTALRT